MPANAVSGPTAAASTIRRPLSAVVPPITGSPGSTSTGFDSPVIALMSTAADPSMTRPSVPIVSPGRTTKRWPSDSSPAGMRISVPSRSRTETSLAPSAANARSAPPARERARASK
ncbi:Uncharacterised protein [Mycobacteroides abscessus subsp. abscessus]|nr:Uncharacterised protein [Mycobacteroides abscessus subsp. abscessus]